MMIPQPPPGQGPIDLRSALTPPVPPHGVVHGQVPTASASVPPPPTQQGTPMTQQNAPNPQSPGAPQQQYQYPGMPPGGYPPGPPPWGSGPPPGYPPHARPPGPFPPSYPPPRRGGWGRTIFLLIVLLSLGLSVLMNVVLFGTSIVNLSGGTGSNYVQSTVTTTGDSHNQIAVIPVEGLIDESMEARFERFINHAKEDTEVKAVVLLIDTPGGTVTASDEIYHRILKFKADKKVPVVVAMRGMATSGGYYIACAADYLCAERTTLTGNIGVLFPHYNISKLMEKWGIEDDTTVATGATFKDSGSPTRAPKPQDEAYFQAQIDGAFEIFKDVVAKGRPHLTKQQINDIANGKAYSGDEALKLGLIDEVDANGYLDSAIANATKQANLSNPQVVQYREPSRIFESLLSQSKFNGGSASGGVTINLDASSIDRLTSGRVMYLYRPGVSDSLH